MALLGKIERLYASGPGLMIYSPKSVMALVEGADYTGVSSIAEPFRSLLEIEQRIVLLSTGSPQLYYNIEVHTDPPPIGVINQSSAHTRFGIYVDGATLCFRDGYDSLEWSAKSEYLQTLPIRDGYYAVDAYWIATGRNGEMDILMYFTPATTKLPGDGWAELDYIA